MFKKVFLLLIVYLFTFCSVFSADISVFRLPNGQTVIIQEIHDNKLVTIDTWVKTGSINEDDKNNGVSHFLEHLFFKGTKKHPTGEFDKILESKGAIVNAATSKDFTHYYITVASNFFDTAMDLHSDMLTNPQIPRKELEKERKVVLEEISKDSNTPQKMIYDNLNDMLYITHPYKRKVIGTENIISTISREEILDYFNKFYSPSNMITIVVGDIDTQKALQKITSCFNTEYKKPTKTFYKKEHCLNSQKRNVQYIDTEVGYMLIGFRGVDIKNCDTYALDVLAQVLGGGKSSKLYKNIKEQKNLAYSISAANGSFGDDGIFYISANFNPTLLEKVEKSIFDEIEYIKKYGITDEELNSAISMLEQETFYSRESTSDISTQLGYITTLTGSIDFYNNYVSNIKKVTAKEVKDVAQKYLGQSKSAVSIALPQNMKTVVKKDETVHTAQKIASNNNIDKYLLDNNATLLLNQHKNNDIVAMSIFIKGGEFLENKIGEATLFAETLLKGTKKYSAQELAQIMEEKGIYITPTSKEDYFVINVQTTTSQIPLTFDILNEIINNPLFDDYELEKKRSEILSKIKQQRDIPMNIALDNYKTLIFENSVYSNSNCILEKNLPKIEREDLLNYHNKIINPQNIIISINGNADKDYIVNEFSKIFKKSNNPKFNYSNYNVTKLKTSKITQQNIKDLKTAWLILAWQTSGVTNKKDFVTLKVINTILGSGLSSRLYRNLREQDGLAYQLGSSYNPKMLAGSFVTYIGTNPNTLNYSKTKILEEIEKLKMEFVSDSELQAAKDRLKGGFVIALEKNSDKAAVVAQFETMGFGFDFYDSYIKLIDEVTASDIIRVANKYFNNVRVESIVKD